jgi:DNA polymerase delta subunit 1
MVDMGVVGAGWVTVPAGSFATIPTSRYVSRCQLEAEAHWTAVSGPPPDGEWARIAPLRVLSFDIECKGRRGVFPEPEHDPVIQIAAVLRVHGSDKHLCRNCFCLRETTAVAGAEIRCFDSERELLEAWAEWLCEADPDVLTGYNIANFDLPFLTKRAATIKATRFLSISKLTDFAVSTRAKRFQSKQAGTRDSFETTMPGRIVIDMLPVIQQSFKLRTYTLNAVSSQFLGETKEDVHHSQISPLFDGDADTRRRLAVYCIKDALLPLRLMDSLMTLFNQLEMARVTGVPLAFLLTRGQQIKVLSQLYRRARSDHFFIPALARGASGDDIGFEGATVIEPKRGWYDGQQPIATLDFASLYPSIMMAYNLCYTTLITPALVKQLGLDMEKDVMETPTGSLFVKPHIQQGLLPQVLKSLLDARKVAKRDLKAATDPLTRAVLDGRQLALKVSANSVYGFTGARNGKLPCLEISSSTTAFGREMIDLTRRLVEEKYTVANGYSADAEVVYGDTDSVMCKFGGSVDNVASAMDLGREAADYVSSHFPNPIRLEFEKVYCPYLLISKKRYAGLYWTSPDKYDKLDMKGLEAVRRDNAGIVKTVIDTALRKILIDQDVRGAEEYVKGTISDLLMNRVDMAQLVITKGLTRSADAYAAKQPHVELAEKMRRRDPGSAPAVGDRVPYVIVQGPKDARTYEKAEDPLFVLEHQLPIDAQYYLHQQLEKPLLRIFRPVLQDRAAGLLEGEHTRRVWRPKSVAPEPGKKRARGLGSFVRTVEACPGCRVPLSGEGNGVVCVRCSSRVDELFGDVTAKVAQAEHRFARLWSECQTCTSEHSSEVLCAASDCPIFYARRKVRKDLEAAYRDMRKWDALRAPSACTDDDL